MMHSQVAASGSAFAVRPQRPGDRAGILALLRRVWGGSPEGLDSIRRLDELWEWRFDRNPYASDGVPGVILERDGAVVGHLSCMPVRVWVHGQLVLGLCPGEWVTDPERGRGFGHRLMSAVMEYPGLALATPNGRAYPMMKRLGWADVVRLENRIRVARADQVVGALRRHAGLAAVARRAWRVAQGAALGLRRAPDRGVELAETRAFDARFDRLWQRVAAGVGAAVVRDSRFLQWRYQEIPDHRYRVVAAERGGELAGYAVFYARERRGLMFGHVIELLAPPDGAGARDALLSFAAEELERAGADLVTCYLSPYDAFLREGLRRCGFFFAKPSRAILARVGPGGAPSLPSPRDWFFSRGDSDLDMGT
jgi:hypothetical protein